MELLISRLMGSIIEGATTLVVTGLSFEPGSFGM